MTAAQSCRSSSFLMMSCSYAYASEWKQMVLSATSHYVVMLILDKTTETFTSIFNSF